MALLAIFAFAWSVLVMKIGHGCPESMGSGVIACSSW